MKATDEAVPSSVRVERSRSRPFPSPLWREGAARLKILFAQQVELIG